MDFRMNGQAAATITMTSYTAEPLRVCPNCGHIGNHPVRQLPSPEFCSGMVNGFPKNYYRVNVGTEQAPEFVEFPQLPSTEEIQHAVDHAAQQRKAAQGKRKE